MDPTRELRERQERQKKDGHAGHRHFEQEQLQERRALELREKHLGGKLTADESLELIMLGNAEHVAALKGAPMTPHQRFLKIMAGQADYLLVRCSDARVHRTDTEMDNLVGIHVYIAGNVIPGKRTASLEEIEQVVSLVRKDGAVLDEAHCECGAVKERVKWLEGGMKPTGSEPLDNLLHEVIGRTPTDNALGQLAKLRGIPAVGERGSGALIYDWKHGGVEILSASKNHTMDLLVDLFNRRHAEADADGQLAARLAKQKPHAIIVGSNLLPFSLGTITHALQNEVFHTTGSEKGLDDFDAGSILYAIEHLHVRHIPFIVPGSARNMKAVRKIFDRWEEDLRKMTVDGKPMIAQMLDSGELRISRLRYDLQSGQLVPA